MDRFYRGFISGVLGGIPMNIWSSISYHILRFGKLRFLDWMGVILYGNPPRNLPEEIYALLIHSAWLGFLGVLFAYFISLVGERGYLGKAVLYSVGAALFNYALPYLFQVPYLSKMPVKDVISNHLGAVVWGLTLGIVFKKLPAVT